jgi:CRP-like cAMP-binding protein
MQTEYTSFIETLLTNSTEIKVNRDEYLIREGEIENYVYFIKSGAIRVFLLNEFEELTIRFGYANSLINSLTSFLKATPSEFYIQAIRSSTIAKISRKTFFEIINKNEAYKNLYYQILEDLITQQIEREIDLLTFSPSERFNRVAARSPQLFQEIPLKYIASYLRMTPETLTRIRNS